jgi:hypothetical protein
MVRLSVDPRFVREVTLDDLEPERHFDAFSSCLLRRIIDCILNIVVSQNVLLCCSL